MFKSTLSAMALMSVIAVGEVMAQTPGPVIDVPADAEARTYSLSGFYYHDKFFLDILDGVPTKVFVADDAYYFNNLFPRQLGDAPIKGDLDASTGIINIPTQHFMYYDNGEKVTAFYFTLLTVNDEGEVTGTDDSGLDLQLNEDGSITTLGGSNVYFGIVDEDQYVVSRARNLSLAPFDGVETLLPAEAEPEDWTYSVYDNRLQSPTIFISQVAIVGNEVYMNGLTTNNAWLKGTLEGDRLTMPNGQYLGDDPWGFIYVVNGVKNLHTNPETYMEEWEDVDAITFTLRDGQFVLDEGLSVAEMTPSGMIRNSYSEVVVKPFEGFQAAVPADPFNLSYFDMSEFSGQICFSFTLANAGTQGEFLDENGFEVALYIDGSQLILAPEDGYAIANEMDWIPFGFADDNWGMDINFTSLFPTFWLYESLANEVGAQCRYTYDGETNYSNIVYVDQEGNTRTEQPGTVAIDSVLQNARIQCYDLNGRQVKGSEKGFGIVRLQTGSSVRTAKVLRR